MQSTTPHTTAPSRPRSLLLFGFLALLLSSCTFHHGKQMEVDFMGARYRFYIYEKPTALLAVDLRDHCRNTRGKSRRSWARCSLEYLHDNVDIPSVGRHEWGVFTGLDQWDDYGGAVDEIVASGFGRDRSGDRFARRCLVGDHTGFRGYNWTTRVAGNSHCKRGVNP